MGEWSRLPRSSLVVAGPFTERACFKLRKMGRLKTLSALVACAGLSDCEDVKPMFGAKVVILRTLRFALSFACRRSPIQKPIDEAGAQCLKKR
jgi:hypothetical protein